MGRLTARVASVGIALVAALVLALGAPAQAAPRGAAHGGGGHGGHGGHWGGHGGHGHGHWWGGGFYAFPYPYPYYGYPYSYPYAYSDPDYTLAQPPTGYEAQVGVQAPAVQREVVYPNGKYVLYGDGVTQPWQWVWVPAPPPPR